MVERHAGDVADWPLVEACQWVRGVHLPHGTGGPRRDEVCPSRPRRYCCEVWCAGWKIHHAWAFNRKRGRRTPPEIRPGSTLSWMLMRHPASDLRGDQFPGVRRVRRYHLGTLWPSTAEDTGEPLDGTDASEVWGDIQRLVSISGQPIH